MHDERLKQVKIAGHQLTADISKGENAEKIAFGPLQPDQCEILPSAGGYQIGAKRLNAAAGNLHVRMALRIFRKSGIQFALQLALRPGTAKADALHLIALG